MSRWCWHAISGVWSPHVSYVSVYVPVYMCRSVGEPSRRARRRPRPASWDVRGTPRGYERQPNVKDQTLLKRLKIPERSVNTKTRINAQNPRQRDRQRDGTTSRPLGSRHTPSERPRSPVNRISWTLPGTRAMAMVTCTKTPRCFTHANHNQRNHH